MPSFDDIRALAYANPLARADAAIPPSRFARVGQFAVTLSLNK